MTALAWILAGLNASRLDVQRTNQVVTASHPTMQPLFEQLKSVASLGRSYLKYLVVMG